MAERMEEQLIQAAYIRMYEGMIAKDEDHPQRCKYVLMEEKHMKKEVMIVTGAGQIGMALARRTGFGKKIILGDKSMKNAEAIAEIMNNAGFDVVPFEMDLSSREDILAIISKAQEYGEIKYLINAAGVSPSQAPVEAILKVDLYGTAVLLEEVGKEFNVTRERIRQIEAKALRKLRHPSRSRKLKDFLE